MGIIISKKFWTKMDGDTWKVGWFSLILTVIWGLISIGIYCYEGPKSYFDLKAILQFKILWVAVIFFGRYFLFQHYRNYQHFPWILLTIFLIILGIDYNVFLKWPINIFYLLLKFFDAILWGMMITVFLEVMMVLYFHWIQLPKTGYEKLVQIWQRFWNEIIYLGIWVTFLGGLAYFYLTSFYLIDTLVYSYLFLFITMSSGLSLLIAVFVKFKRWVDQDIQAIDQELCPYLQWQQPYGEGEFYQRLLRFEYLILLRDYLSRLGKVRISRKGVFVYIACGSFLISLPYIFGLIVEVGSFK